MQLLTWEIAFSSSLSIGTSRRDQQKQFAFSWRGQQYTFTLLPQGYINSTVLCHNLVFMDLDDLSFPQDITPAHYINHILLIGPGEWELATTLDLLIRPLTVRGWEINLTKIRGLSNSMQFLCVQWCGAYRDIPSKVKVKLLHLAPPATKEETQHRLGLFGGNIFHICLCYAGPFTKWPEKFLVLTAV